MLISPPIQPDDQCAGPTPGWTAGTGDKEWKGLKAFLVNTAHCIDEVFSSPLQAKRCLLETHNSVQRLFSDCRRVNAPRNCPLSMMAWKLGNK